MAWMKQQWGIISATLFAIVMISGAYFYAVGAFVPQQTEATSLTAALQAVATRDSDGDGLPDWEEVLYGTNPHKADTFGLGMTDGEAVAKGLILPIAAAPTIGNSSALSANTARTASSTSSHTTLSTNSLTARFTQDFFIAYLAEKNANGGNPLTKQETTAIALRVMQSIASKDAPENYRTLSQITISGAGAKALRNYAATAQVALSKDILSERKWVLTYLQEALQNSSSTEALAHIRNISHMYAKAAAILAQISVPQEAASVHLNLINAYARMATVTRHIAELNTDPLATFLAIARYKTNILALASAYIDLGNVFRTAGVTFTPGDTGASFVNVSADIATEQSTSATP